MTTKLDYILVIDIEATCWRGKPPPSQTREIIEIGLCVLDVATWQRQKKESVLVKPEYSEVSPFCTELTTLTQAQVDSGMTFAEACLYLRREYDSKAHTWASYGEFDRRQFQHQCAERGLKYPFGQSHINVKNLFALQHQLDHELGLGKALKMLKHPFQGTPHRGEDDAWNIAHILVTLLRDKRNGT